MDFSDATQEPIRLQCVAARQIQWKQFLKYVNITEEENIEFHSKIITRPCETQMDAYFNTRRTSANRSIVNQFYSAVIFLVI